METNVSNLRHSLQLDRRRCWRPFAARALLGYTMHLTLWRYYRSRHAQAWVRGFDMRSAEALGVIQNSWMKIIRQGHRVIHKPLMPVCTFGYALTRVGGKKNNFLRRAHFTLTPSASLLPVPTRRNCPNPRRQQRTKCKPQEVEGIRTKFKSSGYRGKPSVAAASGELSPQPSKSWSISNLRRYRGLFFEPTFRLLHIQTCLTKCNP